MDNAYLWIKAAHIISMVAWMAGLFYLPRLYVYHAGVAKGSETDLTFQVMERKLLRFIMNPAMILTFIFGVSLVVMNADWMKQGWLHAKLLLVLVLAGYHGYLAKTRRDFMTHTNLKSHKFYRLINEVPTLALVGIVILVVVKPF